MDVETQNLIAEWAKASNELKELKVKEALLRTQVFGTVFKQPNEGVNKEPIANGWQLKADYKYNRRVDEATLQAALKKLPVGTEDKVIRYKPELKMREYKALLASHKEVLDHAIITTPGAAALELVPPKEKK